MSDNRADRLYRIEPADFLNLKEKPQVSIVLAGKSINPNGLYPGKQGSLLVVGFMSAKEPRGIYSLSKDGELTQLAKDIGRARRRLSDAGWFDPRDRMELRVAFRWTEKSAMETLAEGLQGPRRFRGRAGRQRSHGVHTGPSGKSVANRAAGEVANASHAHHPRGRRRHRERAGQVLRGMPMRLVSRTPKRPPGDAETVSADISDLDATIAAVSGSSVVYLLVGLKYHTRTWRELWPRIMRNAIEACKRANAKLVFLDNVYIYGRVRGPMTEDTPFNPCSRKGEVRAKVATMLLEEIRAGTSPRSSHARPISTVRTHERASRTS